MVDCVAATTSSNNWFGGLLRHPPRQGAFLESQDPDNYDPKMYPELYRKTKNIKGSNEESKPPFDIGIIKEVHL